MTKTEHTGGRVLLALGVLLAALFVLSFCLGRYGVDAGTTCRILLSRLLPLEQTWTGNEYTAVLNIRLPRIVLACLVGCCLSSAGAAYQGVFQNPMASPDVLGASSGASFGAALAILAGLGNQGTTLSAFFWSLATVVLVYLVGQRAPGDRVLNLVLAGMVISSLFTAATSYLKLVADPTNQLPEITYWLMGSLTGANMRDIGMVLPIMLIGCATLFALRWRINILTMGDDEAATMGVNARRTRIVVIIAATLVTAASVCVTGMIGWVGLVIPHLCRMLVGADYRRLIPASMLMGASFLLIVDDVARLATTAEIPIGILTAFTGAPFFLYLMLRKGGAR